MIFIEFVVEDGGMEEDRDWQRVVHYDVRGFIFSPDGSRRMGQWIDRQTRMRLAAAGEVLEYGE
jgi:hypothetical protein